MVLGVSSISILPLFQLQSIFFRKPKAYVIILSIFIALVNVFVEEQFGKL